MAFKEAMELGWSSSMSWEDQVQKEEEWQRHGSTMEGSPNPGSPAPLLEGDNASDFSTVDDSLLQHDSDVCHQKRRGKRSMDTDVPASPAAPMPLKEKSMLEDFEAGDPDDHCRSHIGREY